MARVAFIQSAYREQFGIMYLSAMLKQAGHGVEVFICNDSTSKILMCKNISAFDIIGFSSSTPTYKDDLYLANCINMILPNKHIIFGGSHPTFYPDAVIKENCINSICIGEGYEAIVECANGDRREIYKPREKYDINKLPMPDYELYYKKYPLLAKKSTKQVYIVHNCPYDCAFCWNGAYRKLYNNDKKVYCMNVDKAIKEIKWLKDNYGFKWLQFISDNMTVNKKWIKEFLTKLKQEIDIPYLMNIRCNEINQEIVDLFETTGCDRVDFGLEHGNDEIRNDVLKRNMSKSQITTAGRMLNKAGIRIQTSNMVGIPTDTVKKSIETIKLNQMFKVEIAKCCIFQPFKGTDLYENYKSELQNMDINTGTTIQIGYDGRGAITKVKLKDEKKLVRLSYLFDFFVQNKWLNIFIPLIVSLPFDKYFRMYYNNKLKRQERKYI